MWVISKDGNSISNTNQIAAVFTNGGGNKIGADFSSGRGCALGVYQSAEAAENAIAMLADALNLDKDEVYRMPTDEQVRAYIGKTEKVRSIDGHKPQRHGGS